jgi:hypothetical protein
LFTSEPSDAILIEDEGNRISLGFDQVPRVRTIVTDRYRMSVYQDADWGELYDLVSDPGEITNLWSNPTFATEKSGLQFKLIQNMTRACDSSPWPDSLA